MEPLFLRNQDCDGTPLVATFMAEMGMNLISYKRGDIEVIDQSTRNLFEERYAGLGAIIGPHFYHRKAESISPIADESRFPHIAKVKANGIQEPFSHGIARYAPWKYEKTENSIKGVLTGKDEWNGTSLAALEGQNFKMTFQATLNKDHLDIEMSVVSDTDSLVGLHYYYALPDGRGRVTSHVQEHYLDKDQRKKIPAEWLDDTKHRLQFDLNQPADYGFHPFPDPLNGHIKLETSQYDLDVRYSCRCQENAWQLYHPEGASFVCIEPVSAQDPRYPNLTVSSLKVQIQISPPQNKGLSS